MVQGDDGVMRRRLSVQGEPKPSTGHALYALEAVDNFAASTPAAGTIDCMPLAEIILTLADLCDDLDRRRIARALAGPAPLLDDETAYADLVRASADLDDLAEGLLRPVS